MQKLHIVVASLNPVKIEASRLAFSQMFPNCEIEMEGISVPSEVSDQPMTEKETLEGAKNRCLNAQKVKLKADFWIGLEGGIEKEAGEMSAFAWMYVKSKDGKESKSRTSSFYLPPKITELIDQGIELGVADDMVFKKTNSKQKGGSVGILTNGVVDRTSYYTQAVILALIPYVHAELYV
ncbi:inosine/xanthosine triphosphatase [Sediminitomix flava]|uniref:Probable inosine/xanthosine triphosphatase n=1 Tax=Sediminitomix flava TaxID=379075 RepID=A0A315Z7A7_SEDFL|nr:inosine/xanthosine triphosphatase [Sediminitomix flava]PWJ39941.1 inosine/xanthosine triphosphatase [Sediminitomix flava]